MVKEQGQGQEQGLKVREKKKLIINYRIKYNKVAGRERQLCGDTFLMEFGGEGAARIKEWNEAVTLRIYPLQYKKVIIHYL